MGRRRVEIALAFAGYILLGLGGGAGGVLLPDQIAEYGLNKSVIGLLFFAFAAGYVLAGAANGWLLRLLGLRGDLVVGTAILAGSAFAAGLRPAYGLLLAVTIGFGFGSGVIDASLNAYLASLPRRTTLLNMLHAFYGVGALIGPVLASGMLERGLSWGAVYMVFAAVAAPLTVAFALRYPREMGGQGVDVVPAVPGETGIVDVAGTTGTGVAGGASDGGRPPRTSVFGAAVRHPAVLLCGLFLIVYVGVEVSLGNWAFSFLIEERGQGTLHAGWVVSGFWLGFTLGRFVLGAVAERLGVGPVELTFGCLGVVAASALLTLLVPATPAIVVGFVLLGAALGPVFPLTIAVLPHLAPGRIVPTAIGLVVGFSIVGASFFPWLAGAVAEQVGLESLLVLTLVLTAALLVNWWRVAARMPPAPARHWSVRRRTSPR
jgi:fucose permease